MSVQLNVTASVNDGGQLSYQWYRNTTRSVEIGSIEQIEGATRSSYDAPASTVGTTYYFVQVSNTLGSSSKSILSTVVAVEVSDTESDQESGKISQGQRYLCIAQSI